MRLSDLMEAEVLDASGVAMGRVHDVRLVQDGPQVGSWGAAFRVEGLIVGKGGIADRLGYERSNVHGPWLVKSLIDLFHKDTKFVPWNEVVAIEQGRILVGSTRESLLKPDKL
jgi:sporulation protein YlmC with PRC-barrel domain